MKPNEYRKIGCVMSNENYGDRINQLIHDCNNLQTDLTSVSEELRVAKEQIKKRDDTIRSLNLKLMATHTELRNIVSEMDGWLNLPAESDTLLLDRRTINDKVNDYIVKGRPVAQAMGEDKTEELYDPDNQYKDNNEN